MSTVKVNEIRHLSNSGTANIVLESNANTNLQATSTLGLSVTGTLTVSGVSTFNGNMVVGNAPTDTVDLQSKVTGFNNFSGFTGEIRMYAGNEGPAAPPTGWLYCNGDTISQLTGHGGTHYNADTKGNDYQPLFNLLKTNSNWGNSGSPSWGADTVKLPDFRSRAPVGVHTGAATSITAGLTTRAISVTAGAETHSLTIAELAVHTHTTTATGASVSGQTVSATQPTHTHPVNALHGHANTFTVDPAEHYHGIYFASNYGSAAQVGPGSVVENYYQVNTRSTALAIAGSVSDNNLQLTTAVGTSNTITASLGSETHVHSFAQVNAENSGVSAAGTAHTILSPIIAVNYIIKV